MIPDRIYAHRCPEHQTDYENYLYGTFSEDSKYENDVCYIREDLAKLPQVPLEIATPPPEC